MSGILNAYSCSCLTCHIHTRSQSNSWNLAVEEQKRVIKAHGNEINYDNLQEMDVLHRCITEALRMNPPLILVLRWGS